MTLSPGAPAKRRVLIGTNDMLMAGVQRLVIDQLELLDRNSFDIHLLVLMHFPGKGTFDELIPTDVHVHRLSFSGFFDPWQWIQLLRILRNIRPELVKTATFFSNTVFLLLKPLFRYQVIAAEHNTVSIKPRWQRVVDRILLPRAYTVVGDSQMVVDFVSQAENIDKKHFTVIYNGVDLSAISESERIYIPQREEIRKEYGIQSGAHVIFNAARIVGQKNHTLMVEAFARLYARNKNAYLMIAGDGKGRTALEQLIQERGIKDRVILLGEQKNVHKFYAISDSFLLTSLHEGFCIAAMEGFAFGLPLISTRVAGVSEYLKDGKNGFFVDYDPEDVAQKLEKVIGMNLEERAGFARAGKETAQQYSTERYGATYNKLFHEILF